MSNMPVFYVDELMHLVSGEEWKVLAFLTHKIVGDKMPFEGDQSCRLTVQEIAKGTGLPSPRIIHAMTDLWTYGIIVPQSFPFGDTITWSLGDLENIDLTGLAMRKKASES